ncbi:MAG: outer membrane protein assembly factor BamE [Verrucomicrobiae bacterium]|nr:outer membrane protein assembly factor BamE [Verrucomicrobiae bacterium]
MKKHYLIIGLSLITATSFLTGCANNKNEAGEQRSSARSSSQEEKKVRVGMTKQEVRDILGDSPRHKNISSDGEEVWQYYTNEAGGWVPFANMAHRPQWVTVRFNSQGRVKSYSYDEQRLMF